jgi:hypothetical protein
MSVAHGGFFEPLCLFACRQLWRQGKRRGYLESLIWGFRAGGVEESFEKEWGRRGRLLIDSCRLAAEACYDGGRGGQPGRSTSRTLAQHFRYQTSPAQH